MEADFKRADDVVLRHYLLGKLPEDEQSVVEERLFASEEYSEQLALVEDDLIDSYVRGELSGSEREGFETHFLTSPRRHSRVTFAENLLASRQAREVRSPMVAKSGLAARIREYTQRFWLSGTRVWIAPAVAAVLVVLLSGGVLINVYRHMADQRNESARLRKQIEDLRARISPSQIERGAGVPGDLHIALVARSERGLGQRNAGDGRAGRPEQREVISPGSYSVQLQLPLTDVKSYPNYRVVIEVIENSVRIEVWSELTASKRGSDSALVAAVPSRIFKAGNYLVSVFGVTASGDAEFIEDYAFQAVTP